MLSRAFVFLIFVISVCGAPVVTLAARVPVLNMSAGNDHGGFGDIASNLLFARQLKRYFPEMRIHFDVDADNLKKFKILEPRFKAENKPQKIDDIDFYFKAQGLPAGDYFVSLSHMEYFVESKNTTASAKQTFFLLRNSSRAPVALLLSEYGGNTSHFTDVEYYIPPNSTPATPIITFSTGPKSTGIYVTNERVPARTEYFSELETLISKVTELKQVTLSTRSKIGFGYSYDSKTLMLYLRTVNELAKASPDVPFYIFMKPVLQFREHKHLERIFREISANLHLIELDEVSLAMTNKIIASTNLPILTTGDVSLSLAIQNEKPFLYEATHWKDDSTKALLKELLNSMPDDTLASLKEKLVLDEDFSVPHRHDLTDEVLFNREDRMIHEKSLQLAHIWNNRTFLTSLKSGLKKMKREHSLVKATKAIFKTLEALKESGTKFDDFREREKVIKAIENAGIPSRRQFCEKQLTLKFSK